MTAQAISTEETRPHSALFRAPSVTMTERADGSILLDSNIPLPRPVRAIGDWLEHWAEEAPERLLVAESDGSGGWRGVTYAEARAKARAIGTWLLGLRLDASRPLAILSDNTVDHALMAMAAIYVGVPVASISSAYSLMSADHEKLKSIVSLIEPGAVYVSDAQQYRSALAAISRPGMAIVASKNAEAAGANALNFDAVAAEMDEAAVDRAFAALTPETIARFLFTSGSTATPKAVINTHRMLTSSQEARAAVWPMLEAAPPIICDWLPWSHTFGANHNFNIMLRNGGTLFIDDGRPAPHLIGRTIANIKAVRPTIIFNVPRGYGMLAEALKEDAEFRDAFFSTNVIFYAAAALPQSIWDALRAMSVATTGKVTPLVASWGATETAPLATDCHFQAERSGNIGVPAPGTTVKLVPNAGKLEIRVKGANVMPGYWKQPELSAKAFDEEGFLITGDAVRFADKVRPEAGLFFDGRISEDFKLTSGTWVSVGDLRVRGISALDPVAQDIVVTGHDSDEVGFLIFPNLAACRKIAGLGEAAEGQAIISNQAVREIVARGLARLKAEGGGSSRYAARAIILAAPPDVDAGEITDKGYINQRAVLERRADDVARLQGMDDTACITPA
ncbi:feruloyl-CoA synthase [Pararhizobium haloflavum]|uniref:feruloyl-CoA synthase n=1 Tax=Pararhizobium haloflavum TaxID=2037914 RepID=UPI000C197C61|nr:feruloyl-CoA synthase [Pararhizobium haloflavum]